MSAACSFCGFEIGTTNNIYLMIIVDVKENSALNYKLSLLSVNSGKRSHAQLERSGRVAGGLCCGVRSRDVRHGTSARAQRTRDVHRVGGEDKFGSTSASALDGNPKLD
jgi:hypothetical protein